MVTEIFDSDVFLRIREIDHRHDPAILFDTVVERRLRKPRILQRHPQPGFLR